MLPASSNELWFTAIITLILWIIAIIMCKIISLLTRFVGSRKTSKEKKKLTYS